MSGGKTNMAFTGLHDFYTSTEWRTFRRTFISERLARDGEIIDEYTGKPILNDYDIILHHKEHLTESNVFDYNISLNPDNIMIVSHISHNRIHEKFTNPFKRVYIIFGSPSSGKSTYVDSISEDDDLIVDIDRIYNAINNNRSNKLFNNVMKIWNDLIDTVATRNGRWKTAYVVVANCRNVERLYRQLGGELIYIDTSKEECLERGKDKITKYGDGYKKAIEDFHNEWNETYKKILEPLM